MDPIVNYKRIEHEYDNRGLEDGLLESTEDMLAIHGVDFTKAAGFNSLDDYNKKLYEKFLIRFFNGWGLETRDQIGPVSIHYVEDIGYYITDAEGENIDQGTTVSYMDNGKKNILYNSFNGIQEEYKDLELKQCVGNYLRFDYLFRDNKEWLHVKGVNEFY